MGNDQSSYSGPLLVDTDFLYDSNSVDYEHNRRLESDAEGDEDEASHGGSGNEDGESTSMSHSDSSAGAAGDDGNRYFSTVIQSFYPSPDRPSKSKSTSSSTGSLSAALTPTRRNPPKRELFSFLSRLDSREFDAAAHRYFMSGLVPYDDGDNAKEADGGGSSSGANAAKPRSTTDFSTYMYGEDDNADGAGSDTSNGYGYYPEEESSAHGAESSKDMKSNTVPRTKNNSRTPEHDTVIQRTMDMLPKSLSFSACGRGNLFNEDDVHNRVDGKIDALDTCTDMAWDQSAFCCDDSTATDDVACYMPSFLMRVTAQSTNDLDLKLQPSGPSLLQSLLSQVSSSTDPTAIAYSQSEYDFMPDGEEPVKSSDLRPLSQGGRRRRYHIVTTAALPWTTGTSINPLLRAAYLNRAAREEEKAAFDRNRVEVITGENSDVDEDDVDDDCTELIRNTSSENEDHPDDETDDQGRDADSDAEDHTLNESFPGFVPGPGAVTLVIPWLTKIEDRKRLYGSDRYFNSQAEQESYVRQWLREMAGMPEEALSNDEGGIGIIFYDAAYYPKFGSIFATCNIASLISDDSADVCILEEPEHLNWFTPCSWTQKFSHVVGIIHTNYKAYAKAQPHGLISANFLQILTTFVVRAHCHKIVHLSGILPRVAPYKEVVSNVHGIRGDFLGNPKTELKCSSPHCKAYFIGKILWEKGFDRLLDLQALYKKETGKYFEIDIYGSGPDESEVKRAFYGRVDSGESLPVASNNGEADGERTQEGAKEGETSIEIVDQKGTPSRKREKLAAIMKDLPKSRYELRRSPIPARFLGRRDHAQLKGMYKVFVNCSLSEVLCTTTAESIAMGNWVIIPDHSSNEFFRRFPNAMMYRSKSDFVSNLQYALENDPPQLSDGLARELTWEAATERFVEAALITKKDAKRNEDLGYSASDKKSAKFHATFGSKKEGAAFRNMFLGSEDELTLVEAPEAATRDSIWEAIAKNGARFIGDKAADPQQQQSVLLSSSALTPSAVQ